MTEELLPSLPLQLFSAQATDVAGEYEPRHRAFVRSVCEEQRLLLARQYMQDALACRPVGVLMPAWLAYCSAQLVDQPALRPDGEVGYKVLGEVARVKWGSAIY